MGVLRRLLQHDAAGGVVLLIAAAIALMMDNSFLAPVYDLIKTLPVAIQVGDLIIDKPLLLWVNDGLMAIFFFHVGLEVKHELREGSLSKPSQVVLPMTAALGGMAVPALFYLALNMGDPILVKGWAIPAATDIAFALGVLALAGKAVPTTLKIFLLAVAIIDDIGAILIIAAFYTTSISTAALQFSAVMLGILLLMNLFGVRQVALYVVVGVALWIAVLKSGVHATIAGVLLAFFIPLKDGDGKAVLHELEVTLRPYVMFMVMPVFAFVNAGVPLGGFSLETIMAPLPLGIILGLFFGKQIGVFMMAWLTVKSGLAQKPAGTNWGQIYAVACLAGIGFTMSLFIGGLAFTDDNIIKADPLLADQAAVIAESLTDQVRYGVLTGSVLSGIVGYVVLILASRGTRTRPATAPA